MNIFYLIGHGGSGKSLYAKSIDKYFKNDKLDIVYYDEDEEVTKISGYETFNELLKNENTIQPFYDKFIKILSIEVKKNKNKIFVVALGGYSILIKEELYKNGCKIYIKSSLENILHTADERAILGIRYSVIQGFDTTPKNLQFKEFELEIFKDYYHKADKFYLQKMDFLVNNDKNDALIFEANLKLIGDYIKKNKMLQRVITK